MESISISRPMVALALWTLLVFALIPIRRIRAVRLGMLTSSDFKLGESDRVPEHVALPNRNAMNLLQVPVLFYVACLLLAVSQAVDPWFVGLAWAYVILRVAHSVVHIFYNRVRVRFVPFALSNLVLLVVWLRLAWRLG